VVSRRRRRQGIGKIMVSVESRVRRMEKNPSPKRLKTNVVTTDKLGFRAITTKTVAPDAITPNEAAFGVTVVSGTDPDITKEGTTVVNPTTGAQKVYSTNLLDYVAITDPAAQATADSKNATYYQDAQPTGGTYEVGDMWIDTNDNDKLYTWDGTVWSLTQDSASASSAATTAYNAAIASLQPSANTIVNASNQITAVNTNGITVYSGGSSTTGARIVMNSAGIAGFDATSTNSSTGATFSISASTGAAVFKGDIQSGTTISGATITGGTIRTAIASTTPRIELSSTSANNILFYGTGTAPGVIRVSERAIYMYAPGSAIGAGANIQIYGDESVTTPNGIFMSAGASGILNFSMSSTSVFLTQGTYGLRINTNGVIAVGGAGESTEAMRNIRITQTAPTSGASSGTDNGTIVLVREA
jgi:hypothetical protein